ncbi:MAG: radical SAM protein [Clostridia bacterium]|nr:radical SAM protein [Clostridia bacterium]
MKSSKKELEYARLKFDRVYHTTLNPRGPGAVRIHFVPPLTIDGSVGAGLAIINGQDVIPVNTAWSILLSELICQINAYSGKPISDADAENIRKNTCKAVRKVYPWIFPGRLEKDIFRIMNTFSQIARGETPDEGIGYMTIGEYAERMRAPHRMDLMVSAMTKDGRWNCNQHCVHCYAAGQTASDERELSTDEWKTIIDKCREACIPQVTFTGGEPTMRADLPELISHARWFISRLNTNGASLTPEYCAALAEAQLDSMQITFYSCDGDVHNSLVGAPKYADTVAGIKNALAAGINLSVNTPLCTLNRDYVKTLGFLKDLGVIYVTCSGLITTGCAAGEESARLQLTNAEIKDILREAVAFCHANGMEINFTSPGWVDDRLCRELGIPTPNCGACLSNMAVTPGGNVVPCQSWLSGPVLGNMLSDPWNAIWNGPDCKERRDYSAKMLCECPLRIAKEDLVGKGDGNEK